MTDTIYFNVPIQLLRGVLTGEKTVNDFTQSVVRYSLYRFAKHLPFSEDGEFGGENDISTQIKAAASFLNVKMGDINHNIREGEKLFKQYGNKERFAGLTLIFFGTTTKTLKQSVKLPNYVRFAPLKAFSARQTANAPIKSL
jgi:hypothetical protein